MIEFRTHGEIRKNPFVEPETLKVVVDGVTAETLSDLAHERRTTIAEIVRVGIRMVLAEVKKERENSD